MPLKFELLCIDQQEKVKFKKPKNFILALSIIESLWKSDPLISEDHLEINDNVQQIKLSVQPFDTSKMVTGGRFSSAYYILIEGQFKNIEPFRIKLIDQLKDLGFDHRQILIDDVSNEIAINIYPLINRIENLLRKYIVKFFITKIGTDWWSIAVSKENREKAKSKRSNEVVFTNTSKVIADVTLLNFDQLGKIIYSQSSIFTKIEDVIGKVKASSDLESLKKELLEGNYAKYFKDTFEQNDFQKKWEQLTFIRNKVAHNNYFVQKDVNLANDLCDELTEIINNADSSIDALILSIADKEAMMKAIDDLVEIEKEEKQLEQQERIGSEELEDNSLKSKNPESVVKPYLVLSEEELISKLRECSKLKEYREFVGLKAFVRDYLSTQGYSLNSSYVLINVLADKGKIEIYEVPNPYGTYNTTAIKLIE
ncbi:MULTISPECIES: Swt1 family HEPN domain-containing protein [Cyanophyceae]|uniref:Swt1 family HEPN domain-containing protein n=1 Tax=Cyanophyceae TaxID=3028117 RepID=UPI00232B8563|nr:MULTISPECIES: Swt1 family HEPN domain-containing protein [Cyanophyceae]MDB9354959.1 HEPN domain-containing protein [Nodularia spumigena CS-587/03]MDB9304657.1 HEPN domain-containing protein [Nodularia spumigena CS-591/12]MDB9339331.1 HEPN domain-containing protein [Nodularia spumigena CS-589/07]MDB9401795.1 HEPN domain-containing protein [Microcystis aeruginosa CS-567/02-A1]MDB9499138.1 HEPN domain-containing protein [Nodularia spumigena CS-336/02]